MLARLVREKQQQDEDRAQLNARFGRITAPPSLFPSSSLKPSLAIHRIQNDLLHLQLTQVVPTKDIPGVAAYFSSDSTGEQSLSTPLAPSSASSSFYSFFSSLPSTSRTGSPYLPPGTFISVDLRNPYELYVIFCVPSHSTLEGGEANDLTQEETCDHDSIPFSLWAGGEVLFFRVVCTEAYPYEGPRTRYVGPYRLFHPNIECGTEWREALESGKEEEESAQEEGKSGPRRRSSPEEEVAGQLALDCHVSRGGPEAFLVNGAGWGVCLGLQFAWRPSFMLLDLLLSLWALLEHPNAEDSLPGNCRVAAAMWSSGNREAYVATAKAWIRGNYSIMK